MNLLHKFKIEWVLFTIILVVSGFLRFYDLGYSDYQGDEIKALFNVRNNKEFFEFIFDQRKGPNQFLVTALLREVSNDYYNYAIVRLPFALAGFFSIILFYFIVRNFYNSKVAIVATIFFASNGLLVGFSRIVQYQSFVIFFGLLTILSGQMFSQTKKVFYLYFGFISLAIAVLFHYDGVFFGVPFGLIILKEIYEARKNSKIFLNAIFSGLLFVIILASFYIPFVLNIDNATLEYFQERIEGVGGEKKISSSTYNFNLYQPYFSLFIYMFFGFIGTLILLKNIKLFTNFILLFWIVTAFLFMEFLIQSPGTHIYTYLIPMFIFLGLGLDYIFNLLNSKLLQNSIYLVFGLIAVHLFLQSYVLFVENSKEYPWQDKKYFYLDLKALTQDDNQKYYLSIFGFPYNRNWLEIKEFLKNKEGTYDSSEKSTVGNFYLRHLKFRNFGEIYVEVENPQSFSRANRREYTPVKTIENRNGTKSFIYFLDK